ncbi:BICD family-like cargo adapter 1 isoform X1 [Lates japonicus]|uniref:BICD family-like cargo adapter 1 isoform X1 n=1 Tax=Lates japonicus TaxID=270547 RepID=A0AAD3R6I1_LATJO|nr:BICD family-like cargo adapter 1 isoform X1 [Lates japonicus]
MDRLDEWSFKSKKMDLEEDFYFDYGAEEITDYQDPNELLAALKQKEEEVILAAQLGNALLLENRQLKEQSEKLHDQYADKLEELEQGRHELRLKLEGSQSQWESQVLDLERDVRDLSAQVERLTQALSEAERDKSRAQLEHSEHTQRLREELNTRDATCKTQEASTPSGLQRPMSSSVLCGGDGPNRARAKLLSKGTEVLDSEDGFLLHAVQAAEGEAMSSELQAPKQELQQKVAYKQAAG